MWVLCLLLYFLVGILVAGLSLRFADPNSYDGNEEAYSLVIVLVYPILIAMAASKLVFKAIYIFISFIGGKK